MQHETNNIMVIFLIVMSLNKLVAYVGLQIIILHGYSITRNLCGF